MKKPKPSKNWHAPRTRKGSGDFYGSGIKNPIGRVVDSYMINDFKGIKTKQPPKSLA